MNSLNIDLTAKQIAILIHASERAANGFNCGDSINMSMLVHHGFMEYAGTKAGYTGKYFKLTSLGKERVMLENNR